MPPPPPPPSLVGAYYLHSPPPPDAHAIFLHNELLCKDTCFVTGGGGCITYWGHPSRQSSPKNYLTTRLVNSEFSKKFFQIVFMIWGCNSVSGQLLPISFPIFIYDFKIFSILSRKGEFYLCSDKLLPDLFCSPPPPPPTVFMTPSYKSYVVIQHVTM